MIVCSNVFIRIVQDMMYLNRVALEYFTLVMVQPEGVPSFFEYHTVWISRGFKTEPSIVIEELNR